MSTILLVEDNPHIMKINTEVLSAHGYEVVQATTAAEACKQLVWKSVDLIVLDIMLPDGNGVELCRTWKEHYHVPILFLTALSENQDIVEGLRVGGDDYLPKPYDLEVLLARVEARLRGDASRRRYVSYGNLKLDTVSMVGYVNDRDLLLTQKEFTVLLFLTQNAERKVPQSELMQAVWGVQTETKTHTLWTLISRLRKKLRSEESRLEISSLRGGGYLLEQL